MKAISKKMRDELSKCPVCDKSLLKRAIKCHIVPMAEAELARVARNLLDSAKGRPYTFSSGVANRQVPHYRFIKKHLKEYKRFVC